MAADSPTDGDPEDRPPPEKVPKSERILNLIAYLLRVDEPVPVSEILGKVTGYNDLTSRDSLMRRFERDKQVLRKMGIPIEHSPGGNFGTDGYIIPRKAYFLDQVQLPPGSGQLLRALYAMTHAGGGELSHDLRSALIKLGFLVEGDDEEDLPPVRAAEAIDPGSSGPVASKLGHGQTVGKNLELLAQAIFERRVVRCRYHTLGRDEVYDLDVQPYGLGFGGQAWDRGAWYLVGYSVPRKAVRVYKVGRFQGEVTFKKPKGPGGEYEIPAGFRVREHLNRTRWEFAPEGQAEAPFEAQVAFPAPVAAEVRSLVPSAQRLDVQLEGTPAEWEALTFQVAQRKPFLRFLLRYVPQVQVLAPSELTEDLRGVARQVLARYGATAETS